MERIYTAIFGLYLMTTMKAVYGAEQKLDLGTVEVIGVTPLAGSGVAADEIPSNVQTATSEDLAKTQSLTLAEYLRRYLGSVSVNEAQSNPLQPDIYYRGFVASPLMGMPQGLSTYVNGVRFNEPFGNTVNWGLIPTGAIASIALYPSNPVYGLNSLGGAITVTTKTGFSAPKHQIEVYGGSWGRHSEELTSGWNNGVWGYFIDLRHFEEAGWRNFSPTSANQAFGTLSWRRDKVFLDLTLAANDNVMRGNGSAPVQLLAQDRKAVFTHPDQTITRLFFSELQGRYILADDIKLSGNAYFRQNRMRSFNGDNSDYDSCLLPGNAGLLCEDSGQDEETVIEVGGNRVAASDAVEGATNHISQTNMYGRGGSLQVTYGRDLFKHRNNLVSGVSYDYSNVHFDSDSELGMLTATRGTTGSGVFSNDSRVRLNTNSSSVGVFLSDHFSVTDDLTITVAGRYNAIHINMLDRYGTALNGSHTYDRLNPSTGWAYRIVDNLTFYGGYSESNRAPSPMELSCADPDAPCKLPNAFVSDPPLQQVVAKTYEGGFRGDLDEFLEKGELRWNLGYFHATNSNDIIFRRDASSSLISQGYFDNVGQTRRYGIEAGMTMNYPRLLSGIDDWHFSANYSYLKAQFLSGFDTLNPLNASQAVSVTKGDRIPGIPEHMFKATLSVDLWRRLLLGLSGIYSGARYFRGDEANNQAELGGYWLFNGRVEYQISNFFSLFGRIDNIFNANYSTFGVYGQAADVLGNAFTDRRFVSPGAPRSGWVGVRLAL